MECPLCEGRGHVQISVPVRAILPCPICGEEGTLWQGDERYELALEDGETAVVKIVE